MSGLRQAPSPLPIDMDTIVETESFRQQSPATARTPLHGPSPGFMAFAERRLESYQQ